VGGRPVGVVYGQASIRLCSTDGVVGFVPVCPGSPGSVRVVVAISTSGT
jgi:hypothetical protein